MAAYWASADCSVQMADTCTIYLLTLQRAQATTSALRVLKVVESVLALPS